MNEKPISQPTTSLADRIESRLFYSESRTFSDQGFGPSTYFGTSSGVDRVWVDPRHEGTAMTLDESFGGGKALSFLEDEVFQLKERVRDLQDQKNSYSLSLLNLRSSRIVLKLPLGVVKKEEGGDVVMSCPDLDSYGVGDTEQVAIKDLSNAIEELYFELKKERKKDFGPHMLAIWRFMRGIVVEYAAGKSKRG